MKRLCARQAKPSQAKPSQAKPSQAKPSQASILPLQMRVNIFAAQFCIFFTAFF